MAVVIRCNACGEGKIGTVAEVVEWDKEHQATHYQGPRFVAELRLHDGHEEPAITDRVRKRFAFYGGRSGGLVRAEMRADLLNADPVSGRTLVWRTEAEPDKPGRHYLENEDA